MGFRKGKPFGTLVERGDGGGFFCAKGNRERFHWERRQCEREPKAVPLGKASVGYAGDVVVEGEGGGVVAAGGKDGEDVLLLARREEALAAVAAVVGAARAEVGHDLGAERGAVARQDVAEEVAEAPGHALGAHRAEVGAAAGDGGRLGEDAGADGSTGGGEAADGVAQAFGGTRAAVAEAPRVARRHFMVFQF